MVNKFGKLKYQRGYHNGFGFYFEVGKTKIGVSLFFCSITIRLEVKSVIVQAAISWPLQSCYNNYGRRTILFHLPFRVYLILADLMSLAFYFDIQKVYKVGHVPYVTFVHEFSEKNTIYKPLQGIEKSVRQYLFIMPSKGSRAFGQEYKIFIYIDMDNRFTWMPYTPVEYRVLDAFYAPSNRSEISLLLYLLRAWWIPFRPLVWSSESSWSA